MTRGSEVVPGGAGAPGPVLLLGARRVRGSFCGETRRQWQRGEGRAGAVGLWHRRTRRRVWPVTAFVKERPESSGRYRTVSPAVQGERRPCAAACQGAGSLEIAAAVKRGRCGFVRRNRGSVTVTDPAQDRVCPVTDRCFAGRQTQHICDIFDVSVV